MNHYLKTILCLVFSCCFSTISFGKSDFSLSEKLTDEIRKVSQGIYGIGSPSDLFEEDYQPQVQLLNPDPDLFLNESEIDKDTFDEAMGHIFFGKTRKYLFNEMNKDPNIILVSVRFYLYQAGFGFHEAFVAYYLVDTRTEMTGIYEIGNSSWDYWEKRHPLPEYSLVY